MYKQALVIGGRGTIGQIVVGALEQCHPKPTIKVADRQSDHAALARQAEVIFLTVKPQDFTPMAQATTAGVEQQLIISFMTGITTVQLQHGLGSTRVVRAMPNTPAKIGLGMTAWTASADVTPADKDYVTKLLQMFGQSLEVTDDNGIDQATAVSASGAGYVFLFAEQLLHAAEQIGLSPEQARLLVGQTLQGAGTLFNNSRLSAQTLRQQVTSKGGTTAAAMASLPLEQLQQYWDQAIMAAYEQAKRFSATITAR